MNGDVTSFSSLDYRDHTIELQSSKKGVPSNGHVSLLTHFTYFGYNIASIPSAFTICSKMTAVIAIATVNKT